MLMKMTKPCLCSISGGTTLRIDCPRHGAYSIVWCKVCKSSVRYESHDSEHFKMSSLIPSPTTMKECSQECISLHCKDTKNYPKSGHWSCKCSCHFSQPSEEKDQYGHKIIRPTIPDNTFEGLKEEIKERVSEEKECICTNVIGTTINPDCSIHGITPKQEEWEEEFDKRYVESWEGKEGVVYVALGATPKEIKSFISQLLKEEGEKVIEEVKKNTKDLTKYETEFTCPCGIEHSVQFLIRKPKVMKGKITEITINSQQLKK